MHLLKLISGLAAEAIGEREPELEQDIILVLLYQARRLVPAARPRAKPDPTPTRPDAQRPTRPDTKKGDPKVARVARKVARLSHDLNPNVGPRIWIRDHLAALDRFRVIPF